MRVRSTGRLVPESRPVIFPRHFLKDVFFYSIQEFEMAIEPSDDAPRRRRRVGSLPRSGAESDSDSS